MWVDSVNGRFGRLHNRQIIIISCYYYYYYYYYSYSSFFPWTMNLSTADLRNYRTEFHETWWSYRYMFLVDPKVFRFVVKGINQKHISITPPSFMKFCPVVPEICRGQVHGARKERRIIIIIIRNGAKTISPPNVVWES